MTDLEKLLAIEEIKKLKARYYRCLDTKDFRGLEEVFAPESTFDFMSATQDPLKAPDPERPPHPPVSGNIEIAKYCESALRNAQSVHHGHMPEIEILSDTTAKAIWAMEDVVRVMDGERNFALQGYGHYHETYVKIDGRWRIRTSKLTRLRVDLS